MSKNAKRYLILTYGCQMNVHESEKLAGILEEMGYTPTDDRNQADVVVFNTCAIRETAEQKIIGNIGEFKSLKRKNPNLVLAVCGCMSQQSGYPEMLKKRYSFIDIIFGTHNLAEFGNFLKRRLETKKKFIEISETEDICLRDAMPKKRTSGVNAWINITYGCNNFCSYCIVPYVRGKEVSRPKEAIIREVKEAVGNGYKQITLLGQNVNSYGNDDRAKFGTFAELLKAVDEVDGKFRIRFMTSHPKDLTDDVINVIASSKKICHYLHLPIQSGSNRILALMNRKYTRESYLDLICKARKAINDIEFSSDIIVGFPTETEEDFLETLDIVKQVGYQQLFTYVYSKRKGTVAEKLDGQIPSSIKKERIKRLIEVEHQIATQISEKYIGKVLEVLLEDVHPKKEGWLVGSTDFNKTISVKADKSLIGSFVMVKVTNAKLTTLSGEIVEE
ncbi:MAG: tRNA (N6-isopentenyl adenosine(37)-C2)-methylthiotransferase MiaB [Clostridia bacterium]|nr:tRNA (N6-isopentenyl adenosine(37)-C2)-methylthiotransferase MiaB [Clostridia bacterium]